MGRYKEKVQINSYISDQDFEKIVEIAKRDDRSISFVIRQIIEKHFEEKK